jgi:hypothetical protein
LFHTNQSGKGIYLFEPCNHFGSFFSCIIAFIINTAIIRVQNASFSLQITTESPTLPRAFTKTDPETARQASECKANASECKVDASECKAKASKCKANASKCKANASECKANASECKADASECKANASECFDKGDAPAL